MQLMEQHQFVLQNEQLPLQHVGKQGSLFDKAALGGRGSRWINIAHTHSITLLVPNVQGILAEAAGPSMPRFSDAMLAAQLN